MLQSSQAIINFLEKNDWLNDLPIIISELRDYLDKVGKKVIIYSSIEISTNEKEEIINKINKKYQIDPKSIEFMIDKNILGGLVIKMGDNIIDLSTKNILERIKV